MTGVAEGNFIKREIADEGAWPKVQVVEEEGHPKVVLQSTLLADATAALGGLEPLHYWDFTTNRTLFSGSPRGAFTNTPGLTVSRNSIGTAQTLAGETIQFGINEPRITDRGLLIEGARTNLFLNSAVGVTQNVTVTAAAHVLSFYGTGTITLSGVSTSGPLVGTGENERVQLVFTPSAGTLTLTVTGNCTRVNLEATSQGGASSWIPTESSSASRVVDIVTINPCLVTHPMTIWAEFEKGYNVGVIQGVVAVLSTTAHSSLLRVNTDEKVMAQMLTSGVSQGDSTSAGTTTAGGVYKLAGSFNTDRVQGCFDGVLTSADTLATLPTTPTTIIIGATSDTGGNNLRSYIRRLAIFDTALNDADLQTSTT